MSPFPPPTGRPVAFALRSDPWVELERQRRVRQAKRRRRIGIACGVGALLTAGGGVAAWQFVPRSDEPPVATGPAAAAATTEPVPVPATSVQRSVAELVRVDDVWLLDTGGGSYDWGVILRSQVDEPIGEFAVTARFVDALGATLESETRTVALLADQPARVGGSAEVPGIPDRIDVSVLLTAPLSESLLGVAELDVADVRRLGTGTLDDDTLVGRIAIGDGERGQSVNVSAVWRDERGDIVASVFTDIDVRADAGRPSFEIELRRDVVPSGPPSSVSVRWSS